VEIASKKHGVTLRDVFVFAFIMRDNSLQFAVCSNATSLSMIFRFFFLQVSKSISVQHNMFVAVMLFVVRL